MPTPQEIRKIRLGNDYKQMKNIQDSGVISWEPVKGTPPYVEEYRVTIRVRTIVGKRFDDSPVYREVSVVKVVLPANYPMFHPIVTMESSPFPFHPNWYPGGVWCHGHWNIGEALGDHVIRMVKTLQFDPSITNENDAANDSAKQWYIAQKRSGLFPCDKTRLPDPSASRSGGGKKSEFKIINRG